MHDMDLCQTFNQICCMHVPQTDVGPGFIPSVIVSILLEVRLGYAGTVVC